jgi:hypothetical protein
VKSVLYKDRPVNPEEVNGQFCYIKVTIKQEGDEIVKEEILECADGRNSFDGPSYWELFAQFYYNDVVPQNIADIIVGPDTLLSHSEKCV